MNAQLPAGDELEQDESCTMIESMFGEVAHRCDLRDPHCAHNAAAYIRRHRAEYALMLFKECLPDEFDGGGGLYKSVEAAISQLEKEAKT